MFLTLLNHLCLPAPTDLGPSQERELGLGLVPHYAGRDYVAVTGLSSAGPGSKAAAAAQDLREGD